MILRLTARRGIPEVLRRAMAAHTGERRLILNGPDLNRPGVRGSTICATAKPARAERNRPGRHAAGLGLNLIFHQPNHEEELVDLIQSARRSTDAIVIVPAPLFPYLTRHPRWDQGF